MSVYVPSSVSKYSRIEGSTVTIASDGDVVTRFVDGSGTAHEEVETSQFEDYSLEVVCVTGPLTGLELQHSFDGTNWATVDDAFFDTMTTGEVRNLENINNARTYFRAIGDGVGAEVRLSICGVTN